MLWTDVTNHLAITGLEVGLRGLGHNGTTFWHCIPFDKSELARMLKP